MRGGVRAGGPPPGKRLALACTGTLLGTATSRLLARKCTVPGSCGRFVEFLAWFGLLEAGEAAALEHDVVAVAGEHQALAADFDGGDVAGGGEDPERG